MSALTPSMIGFLVLAGIGVTLCMGALALYRRARRAKKARPVDGSIAPLVRRFEEEQLARMESEGLPLWKPDPEKLKRITAAARE